MKQIEIINDKVIYKSHRFNNSDEWNEIEIEIDSYDGKIIIEMINDNILESKIIEYCIENFTYMEDYIV